MTVQELKAEIVARSEMAKAVMDAVKRGDLKACAKAQKDMREKFATRGA
jgi:hypothetical protein